MSVVLCKEVDNDGYIDSRMYRHYVRVFLVITSSPTDDALIATNTSLLPLLFSSYVSTLADAADFGAALREIHPKRDSENPCKWMVTCDYSSEPISTPANESPISKAGGTSPTNTRGNEAELNPLMRPPEINWDAQKFQEPYEIDEEQKAVVNSASQPFETAPLRDKTNQVLRLTRNETSFDPNLPRKFNDAVNDLEVDLVGLHCEVGEAKVNSITASSAWENGVWFDRVTYVIEIRRNKTLINDDGSFGVLAAWDDMLLDAGTLQLKGGALKKVLEVITDRNGVPVTSAWPLDGNGLKLDIPVGAKPVYRYKVFRPYKWLDLGLLLLPKSKA